MMVVRSVSSRLVMLGFVLVEEFMLISMILRNVIGVLMISGWGKFLCRNSLLKMIIISGVRFIIIVVVLVLSVCFVLFRVRL